jgi:hypothetical protein
MLTEQNLRKYIRKALRESINNFQEKEAETATKQLKDISKPQVIGDPLSDVKMNQKANELGSDKANAPTVAVAPGAKKGGNGPDTGKHQAKFSAKTKLVK